MAAGFPVLVAAINRARLGPLRPDLSGEALRRGGLDAMAESARRLGVGAAHVVFGHTHRPGPLPDDAPQEWRAGTTSFHNTGSWILARAFVGDAGADSPYWPGGAIEVGDAGPPVLHSLLAGVSAAQLRAPGPA
jgi:hypothetical protein